MIDPAPAYSKVRFGVFELDLKTCELRKAGVLLHLPPQPARVLTLLVSRPAQLVTREEIRTQIWRADTVVDFEHGLNFAIKKIRDTLGDDPSAPRYIETLSRRGHRFIAPVKAIPATSTRQDGVADRAAARGTRQAVLIRRLWNLVAIASVLVVVAATLIVSNVANLRDRTLTAGSLRGAASEPRIEAIAVLPFDNLSGDPAQEYFADGMTEQLITALAQIRGLKVISRTSVMRYKGTKEPLPQVARELSVNWLIEGTVQRAGNRVSITAQLIDPKTDSHIWSRAFQRDMADVLALEADIARAIADELNVRLSSEEKVRLHPTRKVNPEAYEDYLIGYHLYNNFHYPAAVSYFELAIQKDPGFAPAYATLADSEENINFWQEAPLSDRGLSAAKNALELDPNLAEAHSAMAQLYQYQDWNWAAAEAENRRAVELNPSSAEAALDYAEFLRTLCRWDAALAEARRALELDPTSAQTNDMVLDILIDAHRFDEALQQFHRSIVINPSHGSAWGHLGVIYELQGKEREAAEAYIKRRSVSGVPENELEPMRRTVATNGLKGLLAIVLERQERSPHVRPVQLAQTYARLGEKDKAIQMLETAYEQHSPFVPNIRSDPYLESLRSDPRFQAILQKVHFPD